MLWKICYRVPTIPPQRICHFIPVLIPKRGLPIPPPPDPWLEDPRIKVTTLNDLVTLNTISTLAVNLAPAARKQVQAVIEKSFKEVKLPSEYTLHSVE